MRRSDVYFQVEGARCAAWLYAPDSVPPHPLIVMAHGFAGSRCYGLDAFAERFASAGLAALVFDYRHFGDSEGEPRLLLDIKRQLCDWSAALAFARSLPEVDRERVALWGTSFSGGHVLVTAARNREVAACVAQVPFVDGLAVVRATPASLSARLIAAGMRDRLRSLLGRRPFYVNVVGPPGSLAAMTSPDAELGYSSIIPQGVEWSNQVAARISLQIPAYRPIKMAAMIKCPVLICAAEQDVVTPPGPAKAVAERAQKGELRSYDIGHFDIYAGEAFEAVVKDQVEFLRRHLLKD